MSDFNFDENTINKIKNMVNNGEFSDVISQIPPEMMQNFSSMMKNNSKDDNSKGNSENNFDFNNIDMATVMKMKSVMEKMNNSNDPRSNLLYSLKPYLRETKQEKLDQYVNLLKVSQIAEVLKNDKKDDKNA